MMIQLTYEELLNSYQESAVEAAKKLDSQRDGYSYNKVACIVAVTKLQDELKVGGKQIPMEALLAMRAHMAKFA